jgi:hypothetical protein
VDLDRLDGRAHREFRAVQLGVGGLDLVPLAVLLQPRRLVGKELPRLDLRRHVGELEANCAGFLGTV